MAKKSGKAGSRKTTAKKKTSPKKVTKSTVSKAAEVKLPARLSSVWQLTKTAANTVWTHRRLFIGLTLVYGLLNLVLVQGLAGNTDVASLKKELNQAFSGHFGSVASSLGVFTILVGSAGNTTSQTAGAYQFFLAVIVSLAIIWALRQLLAGSQLRVRDAYYRGMYPLIPFILVLLVVGIQLLPLLVGSSLYSLVMTNGIAVHAIEKLFWLAVFLLLSVWSLYMISASLFGLYIVTLPNMTPLKALRSAKELVRGRRWIVLRKLLALPVMLLIVAAIIMVPIIIWLTPLAQWVFFLLTMSGLVAVHAYMYTLYRGLLNE